MPYSSSSPFDSIAFKPLAVKYGQVHEANRSESWSRINLFPPFLLLLSTTYICRCQLESCRREGIRVVVIALMRFSRCAGGIKESPALDIGGRGRETIRELYLIEYGFKDALVEAVRKRDCVGYTQPSFRGCDVNSPIKSRILSDQCWSRLTHPRAHYTFDAHLALLFPSRCKQRKKEKKRDETRAVELLVSRWVVSAFGIRSNYVVVFRSAGACRVIIGDESRETKKKRRWKNEEDKKRWHLAALRCRAGSFVVNVTAV